MLFVDLSFLQLLGSEDDDSDYSALASSQAAQQDKQLARLEWDDGIDMQQMMDGTIKEVRSSHFCLFILCLILLFITTLALFLHFVCNNISFCLRVLLCPIVLLACRGPCRRACCWAAACASRSDSATS